MPNQRQLIWLTFSADGKTLAGITYGRDLEPREAALLVWDVATGRTKLSRTIPIGWPSGNPLAFHPDGKTLALAVVAKYEPREHALKLFNLETLQEVTVVREQLADESLTFSKDGELLIAERREHKLGIWEVKSSKQLANVPGRSPFALSANGKLLATADGRIIDTATWTQRQTVTGLDAYDHRAAAIGFVKGGSTLAIGQSGGAVRLCDVATGKEMQPLTGPVGPMNTVAFSDDDGKLVGACADGKARTWSLLGAMGGQSAGFPAVRASYLPEGRGYVGLGADGVARSFDLGEQVRHEFGKAAAFAVSADGRRVLLIDADRHGRFRDLETGKELASLQVPGRAFNLRHLALSHDGRRALTADGNTVRLWDAEAAKQLVHFDSIEAFDRGSIALSPDGRSALVGTEKQVILWALDKPETTRRFNGNTQSVTQAVFSPDGASVVSSAVDGRVIQWNAATGTKLREWQLPGLVHAVAFAADGRHLATANGNGTVYILRIAPPPGK